MTVSAPIITALNTKGETVRINDAELGGRYAGATQDHEDCELYPRFPTGKRPSFAHMPKREHPCGTGESPEHREIRQSWFRFFQKQLSGCFACVINGVQEDDHLCFVPFPYEDGRFVPSVPTNSGSFYGSIVWICDVCLRPHTWDLLHDAVRVISDRRVPGLVSRIRPDITILGEQDRPLSFVEFRKSHLGDQVEEVAKEHDIPLFVVDIEDAMGAFQGGLHNPRRGMWEAAGFTSEEHRWADDFSYRMNEAMTKDGDAASHYCAIPDENGNYLDAVFHAFGKARALPDPAMGFYLVASRSTLSCESQIERPSNLADVIEWGDDETNLSESTLTSVPNSRG